MEENITHALAIFASVLLFLMACACAFVSYNGLMDRTEMFFNATSAAGRREDATSTMLDEDDIKREIPFEEVYVALLNLPKYISNDGNYNGSKINLIIGGATHTFTAEYNISGDTSKIIIEESPTGLKGKKYDPDIPSNMENMLLDILALFDLKHDYGNSNDNLRQYYNELKNITFSIWYEKGYINYTMN